MMEAPLQSLSLQSSYKAIVNHDEFLWLATESGGENTDREGSESSLAVWHRSWHGYFRGWGMGKAVTGSKDFCEPTDLEQENFVQNLRSILWGGIKAQSVITKDKAGWNGCSESKDTNVQL